MAVNVAVGKTIVAPGHPGHRLKILRTESHRVFFEPSTVAGERVSLRKVHTPDVYYLTKGTLGEVGERYLPTRIDFAKAVIASSRECVPGRLLAHYDAAGVLVSVEVFGHVTPAELTDSLRAV